MAVYDNLNMATDSDLSVSVVDYHERNLLKWVHEKTVWTKDLQMRPLPVGHRRAQFRRFIPFEPTMLPLEEGVTKNGQKLKQTDLWMTLKPYGEHFEFTDELDLYHIDNMHREMNEELSYSAEITIDNLARDAKCSGLAVQYANGKTSRAGITASDKMTYAEIKKAVRTLTKNNAQPFPDGYFHGYVDPDTEYDLTEDSHWIDVATYQDKRMFETNEIGIIGKVKFFRTNRPKIYKADTYVAYSKSNDNTTGISSLAISSYDATSLTVTLATNINEYVARQLGMKMFSTGGSGGNGQLIYVEYADAATNTLHLRWAPATALTSSTTIIPEAAGAANVNVHATVIYGQNWAGGISLGGNGHNIQTIIKPCGSSGSDDPYNQRGTMAWKAKGLAYGILQDAFGVRIEYGVSA